MAQQADPAPHRPAVGPQVVTEHHGLAAGDRHQPGADAQQRGLAGPVGPPDQDDLTQADVERGTGQGREAPEERHGIAKVDHGLHGRGQQYRAGHQRLHAAREAASRYPGALSPGRTGRMTETADEDRPGTAGTFAAMQGTSGRGWRWWVGRAGRVLIASGILVLLFAAYQLWGTGIQAARAQDQLSSEFDEALDAASSTTAATTTTTPTGPTDRGPGDHRAGDHGAARDRPAGTAGG